MTAGFLMGDATLVARGRSLSMVKRIQNSIQERAAHYLMAARRYFRQNIISIVGGVLLVILMGATGVSVYSVMERQAKALLTKSLTASLQSRVDLFNGQLNDSLTDTRIIATRPAVVAALQQLNGASQGTASRRFLHKVAQSFLVYGFSGITFHAVQGNEVARVGHFTHAAQLRIRLNAVEPATLLWKGQFFLRAHAYVTDRQGRRVGNIETEARLPVLTRTLTRLQSIGKTAGLAVCAPAAKAMQCVVDMPNKAGIHSSRVFARVSRAPRGRMLPMAHALAGQTGVVLTQDFLHRKVVVAFAPVAQWGLGLTLLVNQAELNGPVTHQLRIVGPLLAILLLAGILLLWGTVTPLVRELGHAKHGTQAVSTETQKSEIRTHTIGDAVDEDALTIPEEKGQRRILNTPAWVVAVAGMIVLVTELLIMLTIGVIQPIFESVGPIFWTFIDPITLTVIVSPALYILIFKPMRNQQIELEDQIAILRRNRHLDALIGAIPDAVLLKDGSGHWLIINEPAQTLFQLRNIAWRGKTDTELANLNPALRATHEGWLASDETAWELGQLLVGEESMTGENGQSTIIETRKMPIFGKNGRRRALAVIARDITEHRRAEQELRIAATTFETGEAILITDRDAHILRANHAFMHLTGYSAEEMSGRTPAMFHSGRQDAKFYRGLWETLVRDGYWQGEIWNRRKDGTAYLEWQTITAVTDGRHEVTHYVGVSSDITLRKKAEEEIHQLAFYDPLTTLPNRSLLLDRLQQAQAYGARHKTYGALFFIDLDKFKKLNDTKGHSIGDLLLTEVAKRLQASVRHSDTVARLGGDEFVVVLSDLSQDLAQAIIQAGDVGKKLLVALNQPYHLQGWEHDSSASMGVSLFRGDEVSIKDLLKQADAAMYDAKAAGRDALRFFDPAMQTIHEGRDTFAN